MSLETNFYLNIRDEWVPLPDVDADVTKRLDRPRSSFISLGNVVYEQLARKANAAWDVAYSGDSADAGRLLQYVATGKAGPVWLYDVQAAQANMLDENSTEGALSTATLVLADGVPMRAFAAGDTTTRMLRAGVAYHLSYTTTHTAATTIGTYDLGAGPVNIVSPAGTGARRGSVAFVPGTDTEVEIVWTVADKTTAAMLREGSVSDSPFLSGENTPCRVAVSDRQQRLNEAFEDRLSRSDTTFQIREVG